MNRKLLGTYVLLLLLSGVFLHSNNGVNASTADNFNSIHFNEVCSSNKNSLYLADGSTPDWIELFNSGESVLDLSGVGLSDNNENRFLFTFPDGVSLGAGQYLLLFCDEKNTSENEIHIPFKIKSEGETLYLTSPDNADIETVDVPELSKDLSYARQDYEENKYSIQTPTPGASNYNENSVSCPLFSVEGGFYDEEFLLALSAPNGNEIYYTLDGSDPRWSDSAVQYTDEILIYDNNNDSNKISALENITLMEYKAPDFSVDKGIVVRAVCKNKKGEFGNVKTNNYYISKTAAYYKDMKVISITTDNDNLFDDISGIYVIGQEYYKWKNGDSFDPSLNVRSNKNPTNYNNKGKEWERPCAVQVYDKGKLCYTTDAGIRISGQWSAAFPQKSFNIYARNEYGSKRFDCDFFENGATDINGEVIRSFKKITLRNGGNDWRHARFRDDLNQKLAGSLNFGTQAKEDYIVFINGEFWGYYSMQEKYDENYIESHYLVPGDEVTIIKKRRIRGWFKGDI